MDTPIAMQAKLEVLKAAFGICSLPEADLFRRLEDLFLEGVKAGASVAKATEPRASAVTPPDTAARAELALAITTLGRLLPFGMEVRFYRQEGEERVVVESTYADGEVTRHWFTDAVKH